jgi:hypothetical protein
MTHYHGSCQCGAVDYDVEIDSLDGAVTCNCSRCQRLGSVLVFTPRDKFRLNKGHDALSEYRFNNNVIHHKFCRICGIEPFAYGKMKDGTPIAAINVNCLDSVDPRALETKHYDGASV